MSRVAKFIRAQRRCLASARILAIGVILVLLLGAAPQPVSLTISAAISLKDALDEIALLYKQSHPGVEITLNYGGSGTLRHQIEQGAPVDVFIAAADEPMDALESEGMVAAETRRNLVSNELVLVVPRGSAGVANFEDLAQPEVKIIALGDPATVPAGMYARETLAHLGLFAAVEKKAAYAKDVRQVLTYVETGNADAGIVYRTDANASAKVRVVAAAPAASHEPIAYPAAVLKGSKHPDAARAWLEFLAGSAARAVFVKHGFAPPEK